MSKKIILTGDRPTGKLHLGHYVGSLKNRVELQNSGDYDVFVFAADLQALTDNAKNPKKIQDLYYNMEILLNIYNDLEDEYKKFIPYILKDHNDYANRLLDQMREILFTVEIRYVLYFISILFKL